MDRALDYLETLRFSEQEIAWLAGTKRFGKNLLDYLSNFRFAGDIHAMPEGTPFFAGEPVLRVTAPLPQAQFVESRLINIVHYQLLVAAKAARCVLAAPNKLLVDFGMRRAHGAEAGLMAAQARHRGFRRVHDRAGRRELWHPAVRHHGAFLHRSVRRRDGRVRKLCACTARQCRAAPRHLRYRSGGAEGCGAGTEVKAAGIAIRGVRLDSGDLVVLSRRVRDILDGGGLREVTIFSKTRMSQVRQQRHIARHHRRPKS